ncbi:MAG: hypothetical protein DRO52_03165 [Candidatus Hecatellales archaeon]|nr:MAG: hypothetical protein DRO52_03165 [Candidatus Hecatellales archaeon]
MNAASSFALGFPILLGVILLMGLLGTLIPSEWLFKVFTANPLWDTLTGAAVGSIAAGNPINSYVMGGELLKEGVSLYAVTAFIIAWVTVGLVQLPAEAAFLGGKFAILRNGLSFILALPIAAATGLILSPLG